MVPDHLFNSYNSMKQHIYFMLQVLIGNGVLLTCSISRSAYDVERFSIDKTICSKVTFEEEIFDG